jgi:hypothetical protein
VGAGTLAPGGQSQRRERGPPRFGIVLGLLVVLRLWRVQHDLIVGQQLDTGSQLGLDGK